MRPIYIVVSVVAAILVIVALELWQQRETPPAEVEAPTAAVPLPEPRVAPSSDPVAAEPEQLPPNPALVPPEPPIALAEADGWLRRELATLADAFPTRWWELDDLTRRAAVLLENAQRGELPRRQLSFLALDDPFAVIEEGDSFRLDPVSFKRFDPFVTVITRVEPAVVARLLSRLDGALGEALQELGVRNPPEEYLQRVLAQVADTPVIRGPIYLEREKVLYTYADPALEQRSDLQKQLLRMGPDNVAKLQSYAQALSEVSASDVSTSGTDPSEFLKGE